LPLLRAYVRRIAGSRQLAGYLLQDVSVRILAGAGPTDPRDFLAWCLGIARHALSYQWRMQKRAREAVPPEGALWQQSSPSAPIVCVTVAMAAVGCWFTETGAGNVASLDLP
jgi:DNA-directed RNA polymerase specialized sigma24 family protein